MKHGKLPSPAKVNRMINSMPAKTGRFFTSKEDARRQSSGRYYVPRGRWTSPNERGWIAAKMIRVMANKLLQFKRQTGSWPNAYSRWWRKDRLFRRAMRLAKLEFERGTIFIRA